MTAALAAALGFSETALHNAIHGITWASVTDPPPVPAGRPAGSVLGPDDLARIRSLRKAGVTYAVIAAEYGVSLSTISRVCRIPVARP